MWTFGSRGIFLPDSEFVSPGNLSLLPNVVDYSLSVFQISISKSVDPKAWPERVPCSSPTYSVPTFPHRPRPHRQLPRWPPGPKRPPPYSVTAQSLSRVCLFATSWTEAHQAPLSSSDSWSLLKFMSTELVSRSNHLILCSTLLLRFQSFPASGSFPVN